MLLNQRVNMNFQRTLKAATFSSLLIMVLSCNDATSDTTLTDSQTSSKSAVSAAVAPALEASIRKTLTEQLGPVPVQKIKVSELEGFYEVFVSGQMIYISHDQKFLFPGPLLKVEQGQLVNLSQNSLRQLDHERAPERAEIMAQVKEDNMVVFRAPQEKYVVDVFTDVDCAYCRRLHQNMEGYLERGITIRYLAFPRAGVGSGAYNKLVSVWCSKDRQSAMDDAKLRNKFDIKECDNPVADQYSLTRKLGLNGTPALILSDGELISGFLEPDKLEEYLTKRDTNS